jgi:hypothetical protein
MNTGSMMKTEPSNFLIMTQWSTSLPDDDTPSTTVCTAAITQVSHSAGTEFVYWLGICYAVPEVYSIYPITSCTYRVGFVILHGVRFCLRKRQQAGIKISTFGGTQRFIALFRTFSYSTLSHAGGTRFNHFTHQSLTKQFNIMHQMMYRSED